MSDCNAFNKWNSIDRQKLSKPPADLDVWIEEGKQYPSGESGRKLDGWLSAMEPIAATVAEGSQCRNYSDPTDKNGAVDLEALSKVMIVLKDVEKYRIFRVKRALAHSKFSDVRFEIEKLFDIARTGNGGTRTLSLKLRIV